MRTVLLVGACLLTVWSFGQVTPGGVGSPELWYQVNTTGAAASLTDVMHADDPSRQINGRTAQMNYQSAVAISASSHSTPRVTLPDDILESSTIFIVYRTPINEAELCLWNLVSNDTSRIIQTTHRIADMSEGAFALTKPRLGQATLQSFIQFQQESDLTDVYMELFRQPIEAALPVHSFSGDIAELILYDRVLSEKERIQVETYLSLKYGIHVTQFRNTFHIDSEGEIFRSSADHIEFDNRVTGIGRDDGSGLYQRQSSAADNPELLSIALGEHAETNEQNSGKLEDKEFLLWSDNGAKLEFNRESVNDLPKLLRSWRILDLTRLPLKTELVLDRNDIVMPQAHQMLWLEVRDGSSKQFVMGTEMPKGKVKFSDVSWDNDRSGEDEFTFVSAPSFFLDRIVAEVSCQSMSKAELTLKPVGGRAPYKIQVHALNGAESISRSIEDTQDIVLSVASDEYRIYAQDADGNDYSDTLFIGAENGPTLCLETPTSTNAYTIDLSLCSDNSTRFEWTDPNGITHNGQQMTAELSGRYVVKAEREGCISYDYIDVMHGPQHVFEDVVVMPNPARSGDAVGFRVQLSEAAPLGLEVISPSGQLVMSRNWASQRVHTESLTAPQGAGTYTLVFTSGNDQSSIQLIVIQ